MFRELDKTKGMPKQIQKNVNARMDHLSFKVCTYEEFHDEEFFPMVTTIYVVLHGDAVELYKGNIRIFIGNGKIDHALVEILGTL